MERERKFLVQDRPPGLTKYPHAAIRQGYIAVNDGKAGQRNGLGEPVEVRVRRTNAEHVITAKGGGGSSRVEEEIPISKDRFRSLWRLTKGRRIEKTRYRIPFHHQTIELDVYHGRFRPLITAEVEFHSKRGMRHFAPPPWIGTEITGQRKYRNSYLARFGMPRPGKKKVKRGK